MLDATSQPTLPPSALTPSVRRSNSRRPTSPFSVLSFLWVAVSIFALTTAGCGEGTVTEQLSKGLDQAKESVSKGVEQAKDATKKAVDSATQASTTVKEAAGLAGRITLTSNPPVITSGAYVSFVPATATRRGALQVQSYAPQQAETFPSVFIRALVDKQSLNELSGASLPCEIFVQSAANGSIWRKLADDAGELKINALEGKLLRAELVGVTLHDTATGEAIQLTGQVEAVVP